MKAATLFSGIGAPETARPDFDWLWSAEIEPFPSRVMRLRHPGSINLGDVTSPTFVERALDAGRPDLIVFGSPCQAFSVAGKRLGLDDPRGNLALTALALVEQLRPKWVLFENVPGLFTSFSGSEREEAEVRKGPVGGWADSEEDRDFAAFLTRVRECGYSGCWRVLDAQYCGVPQRRRRLFFVAHSRDWRSAAAVLFEPASLQWHPAPGREAGKGVARPLAACAPGSSGYRLDADTADNLIAAPLKSRDGKGTDSDANGLIVGAVTSKWAKGSSGPAGNECYNLVAAGPIPVRRLTPRECERLQGFPDDYTMIPGAADGPRYRALGNSMAVPVLRWLLDRIEREHARMALEADAA